MISRADVGPPESDSLSAAFAKVDELEERVRAQAAQLSQLSQIELRYRSMVEQAQEGFFVADARGIYVYSNQSFRQLLGYSEEELHGKHIRDMVDPADLSRTPLRAQELHRNKRMISARLLRRKDGSSLCAEITASQLEDGTFQAIVRDVTERIDAEAERTRLIDELRHAHKLESIGRLAGNIAHDFNNLLLVITANVHVLRRASASTTELDAIVAAAERGSVLTRQLLSFSRDQTPGMLELDLNEVVRGLQGILQRLMGEHISLSFSLCEGECRILGDSAQIEQVIMNLLVNARDACAGDGRVHVSTELLAGEGRTRMPSPNEVRAAPGSSFTTTGQDVVLRVQDSGHGMDRETQARIFEPFFTTKQPGEGTGLGLSMVYSIVTQSGGSIGVKSLSGFGSVFELRFAAVRADVPQRAGAAQLPAGL
jgi:two-component system cell cycle sensor histidine kinase/response regulator CckA